MTLAHAGFAVVIAGVTASSAWKVESVQSMRPGDKVTVAGYEYTFEGARRTQGPNYFADRGTFTVRHNGIPFITLYPEKRSYPLEQSQTTEAAIHPTFLGDLYAVIGDPAGNGAYVTRIYFNPLVAWMWTGVLVMVGGGLVSLTDRRLRVGAPARARIGGAAAAGA